MKSGIRVAFVVVFEMLGLGFWRCGLSEDGKPLAAEG